MSETRVKEVFSDEAFVEKLFSLESPEEAQALLKEQGLELSVEELNTINEQLKAKLEAGGELSLDNLDNVAGGGVLATTAAIVGIAAGIVTIAPAIKNFFRSW